MNDLKLINREYSLGIDHDNFIQIYNSIINENFNNFLLIDCNANNQKRFRKNLDVIEFLNK